MARFNVAVKTPPIFTHEGGKAVRINTEPQLRRLVLSTLLWERQFYCDGIEIAEAIRVAVGNVAAEKVAALATEAREKYKLRHVPLLLVREMAGMLTHRHVVADTLSVIIQRPDELGEYLALYWKDGKCPISAQSKKGLARAFHKFNAYQLEKWNRDRAIRLRDVAFLSHVKAGKNKEFGRLIANLVNKDRFPQATKSGFEVQSAYELEGKPGLPTPETWETELSAGKDKKETWERLIREKKLGAMALLMNLRNMQKVSVDALLIKEALLNMRVERILPYRFITAARYAPDLEPELEKAMLKCLDGREKLPGHTLLLIDISGSMDGNLSAKSEMTRLDAACGLAILCRELCESVQVWTFSEQVKQVPSRHGFALRDAIYNSQSHSGTYLGKAVGYLNDKPHDRLIVLTDEQSHDDVPHPKGKAYLVNVASYQNGVGYREWTHVDGFSEAIFDWVREIEGDPKV